MARDWEAEWQPLCEAEIKTFKEFQAAQAELTNIFSRDGAPKDEQIDRAELAHQAWEAAKQHIEDWLDEWWASTGLK